MRITTSKDKTKVIAFAKRTKRKLIWLDDKGIWHASESQAHTPLNAIKVEYTPGVTHWKY